MEPKNSPYGLSQIGNGSLSRLGSGTTQCEAVPKSPDDNVASKLGELDASLHELLASSTRLANSLAGSEPQEPGKDCPVGGNVLSQLDGLRRLAREVSRQLTRANQAVGN